MKQLFADVPAPVRAFFASGKVETVAKNLMQKNQLHIDQGAIVQREILLLILGLKSPDGFMQTLTTEANLNKQTVDSIVQDVNDQIFVPLQEEEKKSRAGDVERPAPLAPPAPPALVTAPQPGIRPAISPPGPIASNPMLHKSVNILAPAGTQQRTPFNVGGKTAPSPAQSASAAATVVPRSVQFPTLAAPTPSGTSARPALRDVLSSVMKTQNQVGGEMLLEDHEEPHIEFNKRPNLASQIPPPQPNRPPIITHGMGWMQMPKPHVNVPGAMNPRPLPPQQPAVAPASTAPLASAAPQVPPSPVAPSVPTISTAPAAPAKPYSSDPYREPIE